MALVHHWPEQPATDAAFHRCSTIRRQLIRAGLWSVSSSNGEATGFTSHWRIATTPFWLTADDLAFFSDLGGRLLSFYRALNRLYFESVRGSQPPWVASYLDQGKPESLVAYSRMNRFRQALPAVIRPDVLPTDHGMVITELDSVPGGIGVTAALTHFYEEAAPREWNWIGGASGMIGRFGEMLRHQLGARTGIVAIVVSDEAKEYRPEMEWAAARLSEGGLDAACIHPRDLRFTEEGFRAQIGTEERPVAAVYRFFELFDLKNIPKVELLMYGAKKDLVVVTPPFKPALEEKLAFALLHHPLLTPFWERELGEDLYESLQSLMPRTWVLDPSPIPPTAVIPDLTLGGRPLADWRSLAKAGQKERRYVLKPSGFSEQAWGSRGVSVGHDLPLAEWEAALDRALASFPQTPHVLQVFHKSRSGHVTYHDPDSGEIRSMTGRARLCPYYFVVEGRAELGGILATVTPAEKKVIHGMQDAVMVPCAVAPVT